MQIYQDLNHWRQVRQTLPENHSLGFVPTMGNLHEGHASLYEVSHKENDYTAATIFVNPTQFNNKDDFTQYPRTLEQDLSLLESLHVDFCILPEEKTMYPEGYRYQISEHEVSLEMEGRHRPGHFTGMLTVVMKLLNLVKPHRAYFGEKDYQQYQLIRDMTSAFFLDTKIISCPTVREPSGLAFSSRNNRLNDNEKVIAEKFAHIFHQTKNPNDAIRQLEQLGITVEYLEEHQGRRFIAVKIGEIRLIDNYCV
jgi:pantoate--beta-alanine ligase